MDTGIGIARDALAKLGRPFEQVESQHTKTHQGSGLGLAIAKSLVELHGGTMRIRSILGRGTIVIVRLPIAPNCVLPKGEAA
jgi:two-component system cell cycle sensor histidine kinase PleC